MIYVLCVIGGIIVGVIVVIALLAAATKYAVGRGLGW